ncbi:hypothetical protein B0H14DRAFT_2342101, partial [Mycena olivaceomarginata]
ACPGSDYVWSLPDILASYPLSIHTQKSRHDPGYSLLAIDIVKSVLRVRSTYCRRFSSYHGTGLLFVLPTRVFHCGGPQVSNSAVGKKPASRLSHDQMETKLVSVRKKLKNEQLKVNNLYAGLRIIVEDQYSPRSPSHVWISPSAAATRQWPHQQIHPLHNPLPRL